MYLGYYMCTMIKPPAALGEEKGRYYRVRSLHSKETRPKWRCLNSVIFRVLSEWTGIQTYTGLPGWFSSPQLPFCCIPPLILLSYSLLQFRVMVSTWWSEDKEYYMWRWRISSEELCQGHDARMYEFLLLNTLTKLQVDDDYDTDILRVKMDPSSHVAWWELAWNIQHLCINCSEILLAIHILTISELRWVKTF